jgi:spore coat polysaccharide biosynthesis predicted glycosyltransferase SpsG
MKGKTKKTKLEGKLVFCCLAGEKYGLGHVHRCLKLARKLHEKLENLEMEFIIYSDNAKIEIIKEKIAPEFPVKFVKNLDSELKKGIIASKPRLVLIDMLSLRLDFLKPRDYKIISLDNYFEGADAYINILKSKSGNLKNEHSGYKYWIIELPKKELVKRKKTSGIKKILISCGYSDPGDMTENILKSVTGYYKKNKSTAFPEITCITTSLFKKGVEERLRRINERVVIKKDVSGLDKEIVNSNLCIVCGGNTMFESITFATPTVVVSCEPRNYGLSKELEKDGYVKVLEKSKLANEMVVHKFFKTLNADLLNNLHDKCLDYDGYGIDKIMDLIKKSLKQK